MADTVDPTETVTPEAPKNNATTVATPVVNATDSAEVERLRKEAEQARMEANMLRNRLKAEEDAKAAAEAERLKKNEEYQTLYEQERAKREDIERAQAAEERKKELVEAKQRTLNDYPDEVKAIAEDTGLELSDATDEAVTEFRAKLDKLQTRLGVQKVTANNPGVPSGKKDYAGIQSGSTELYEILNDPVKRDAYERAKGGSTAMMMSPEQ